MQQPAPYRALVSVSDKTGLAPFARGLVEAGFEIVSTGGTRRFLQDEGIPVLDVSDVTGFPEIMDGRVKTLHPKVHGAILGRPERPGDAEALAAHGIVSFQVVVCNLYPFEATVARTGVTLAEAIEQIDIGGPSMVRSAAKNHAYVVVVTQPSQYDRVLEMLRSGTPDEAFRRELAAAAFEMTARYDRAIADYMARQCLPLSEAAAAETRESAGGAPEGSGPGFPAELRLSFRRHLSLRYGENPHQRGAFYADPGAPAATLARAEQLHGKELSYNNLLDLEAALSIAREFAGPAAVVIKHNNPCGCGAAGDLAAAFEKAYLGDPVSAFGSVLGFNRPVDLATAELLCQPDRFVEAIIAPGYEEDAFAALTSRPKWKQSVRLLACAAMSDPRESAWEFRSVSGGLLVQDRDEQPPGGGPQADRSAPDGEWSVVTERAPSAAERADLAFAWRVAKHVKSNAIVFARQEAVVGVGAGQMSRLDSVFIAAHKAGDRAQGGVLASDAFFPFRDGVDEAARAGITAVVQPGGSRRDDEAIAACNEHGLAMLFTGRRHFRH